MDVLTRSGYSGVMALRTRYLLDDSLTIGEKGLYTILSLFGNVPVSMESGICDYLDSQPDVDLHYEGLVAKGYLKKVIVDGVIRYGFVKGATGHAK